MTFFSRYWYAIIGSVLAAAFIVYHYRRASKGMGSATINAAAPNSAAERSVGMLFLLVAVVAFIWDRLYGYRVMGLACIGFGLWASIKRRVPYGIEGKPPRGYITGALAVVLGAAMVALGLLLLLSPASVDDYMSSHG